MNYEKAKKLGNIVSVQSSDEIFAAMLKLIREREGWKDPSQYFKEADLKEWLIKRSGDWELIRPINFSLRMNPATTYAQGRDAIKLMVDQKRQELALETAMSNTISQKSSAEPKSQYDFSMSANTVTMSREEFLELTANATAPLESAQRNSSGGTLGQPSKRSRFSYSSEQTICFLCHVPGHRYKDCPYHPQPPQPSQPPQPPLKPQMPQFQQQQYNARQNRFSKQQRQMPFTTSKQFTPQQQYIPQLQYIPQQYYVPQQQYFLQQHVPQQQYVSQQQSHFNPLKRNFDQSTGTSSTAFNNPSNVTTTPQGKWVPRGTRSNASAGVGAMQSIQTEDYSNAIFRSKCKCFSTSTRC